jgi:hypothetical protein
MCCIPRTEIESRTVLKNGKGKSVSSSEKEKKRKKWQISPKKHVEM